MSATARNYPARIHKFPPGFAAGTRVISNARYAGLYPKAPKQRRGTVEVATASPKVLRVRWDDAKSAQAVDIRFFNRENSDG